MATIMNKKSEPISVKKIKELFPQGFVIIRRAESEEINRGLSRQARTGKKFNFEKVDSLNGVCLTSKWGRKYGDNEPDIQWWIRITEQDKKKFGLGFHPVDWVSTDRRVSFSN